LHVTRLVSKAQGGADPREQFADAERLVDVVVRPTVESRDLVGLAVAGGDHDHRDLAEAAQPGQHVLAIDVGQPEIEQHEVRRAPRDPPQRLGAVGRAIILEPGDFQGRAQEAVDGLLVIHHQDTRPAHAGGLTGKAAAGS